MEQSGLELAHGYRMPMWRPESSCCDAVLIPIFIILKILMNLESEVGGRKWKILPSHGLLPRHSLIWALLNLEGSQCWTGLEELQPGKWVPHAVMTAVPMLVFFNFLPDSI